MTYSGSPPSPIKALVGFETYPPVANEAPDTAASARLPVVKPPPCKTEPTPAELGSGPPPLPIPANNRAIPIAMYVPIICAACSAKMFAILFSMFAKTSLTLCAPVINPCSPLTRELPIALPIL